MEDICIVCAEPLAFTAFAPCGHKVGGRVGPLGTAPAAACCVSVAVPHVIAPFMAACAPGGGGEPLSAAPPSAAAPQDACSKCVSRLRSVLKDQRCVYCQARPLGPLGPLGAAAVAGLA